MLGQTLINSALTTGTVCIWIRTAFRVVELSQGFSSTIAQNEPAFFVLESSMILIGATALTVLHPGLGFRGRWTNANFTLRGTKVKESRGQLVELRSQKP